MFYSSVNGKHSQKFIHDHVLNEDIDVNVFSRDEIITLQSLIHNQFCNEKFRTFRIESWKRSGYIDTKETERRAEIL